MLKLIEKISKSLVLPASALPLSAILMRFGQPDLLNIPLFSASGQIIFDSLPLLFAIAIAMGFGDENDSSTLAMSALIGFLIFSECTQYVWISKVGEESAKSLDMATFSGLLVGVFTGVSYKLFSNIKMPKFFNFYSGKRFIPIIVSLEMIALALISSNAWIHAQSLITELSMKLSGLGSIGVGIFGILNRLLIPLGLHHVTNSYFWYQMGDFNGASGDIARFFAGDPTAGAYLTGFYPVMMFGLPAIALAIYTTAKKENQKNISGLLFCLAAVAMLTGITEPLEFLFIFASPLLWISHAMLSGLSSLLVSIFGALHGFTFSAGLIDFISFYEFATKPIVIILVGILMFILYFVLFKNVIEKYDVKTLGRDNSYNTDNADNLDTDVYSVVLNSMVKSNSVSKEEITETTDNVKMLIDDIKISSYNNKTNSNSLLELSGDIKNSADTVDMAINSVLDANMNQSNTLNNTLDNLSVFRDSVSEFVDIIEFINEKSIEASNGASISQDDLIHISFTISTISRQMSKLTTQTTDMLTYLKKVESINSIIAGIASRTNMLSLNASIEAARVGQEGKGFAVIANTIRELSTESTAAASDITDLVSNIISSVNETASIAQSLDYSINEQLTRLSTTTENLSLTLESTSNIKPKTDVAIKNIQFIMDTQNLVLNKIVESADDSSNIVSSSEEISAQMKNISGHLERLMDISNELVNSANHLEDASNKFL